MLGLGTVGTGTVNVLQRNAGEIARRAGRGIEVTRAAVRDPGRARDCDLSGIGLTGDARSLVDDPAIDVIVELVGGTGAARDLVLRAIRRGKHVVTANKALIALARERGLRRGAGRRGDHRVRGRGGRRGPG